MCNPNGHYDPKKPQFCHILPIFSYFLAKIIRLYIIFFYNIFKKSRNMLYINMKFKKNGMRNPNGYCNPKYPCFYRILAF